VCEREEREERESTQIENVREKEILVITEV